MSIAAIQKNIIEACTENNSFLVQLHSMATFDSSKYHHLIRNISKYVELLGDSRQLDRNVAGCLFELMLALDKAFLSTFPDMKHPDFEKVADAHYEVWGLLEQVFRIMDETEPK